MDNHLVSELADEKSTAHVIGITNPLFLIALCLFVMQFAYKRLTGKHNLPSKIPQPPGYPIIGNLLEIVTYPKGPLRILEKWIKLHGKRLKIQLGWITYYVLCDPNDLEVLLKSKDHSGKPREYNVFVGPATGVDHGVFNIRDGKAWHVRRKLMNPGYKTVSFYGCIPHLEEVITKTVIAEFQAQCNTDMHFDIKEAVGKMAYYIGWGFACGYENIDDEVKDAFNQEHSTRIMELFNMRITNPILMNDFIWKITGYAQEEKRIRWDFLNKKMTEHAKIIKKGEILSQQGFPKFLQDMHASSPDTFSQKTMTEEMKTAYIGAYDTTERAVCFFLMLMAVNTQIQDSVHEELKSIFGNDMTRPVEIEDVSKMKLLTACIKESLRVFPPGPVISRKLDRDLVLDNGAIIANGAHVVIPIFHVHRNESIFPNPEEFKPSRFLSQQPMHPCAWIPFSVGPRNCIGQSIVMLELKIILSRLLRRFRFESPVPFDIQNNTVGWSPFLESMEGYKMKIFNRH